MVLPRIFNLITISLLVAIHVASVSAERARYIVVLNTDITSTISHYAWMAKTLNIKNFVNTFLPLSDKDALQIFSVENGLKGYSGYFEPDFVENELKARSEVKYVELDQKVKINYAIPSRRAVQNGSPPNLDRIDQQSLPLDGRYNFPNTAGQNVDVYVVDTGILTTANEFEGRARSGGVFCQGCPDTDDNGHGTHVAGIVGAKTFGVAKKAKLIGVKVLAADGSGSNADVINGLQAILEDHSRKANKNSIVNMSLGGPKSAAVNDAVKALTDAGVHVVVAAGNEAVDACLDSPSSEPSAITVAASDADDTLASFSNFGRCVDIIAPGVQIESVGIENDDSTQVFSGTSQASPHVAGTIALIISKSGNKTPADMADELLGLSTGDEINGLDRTTANQFLRVPDA